jgi:glycosyltransferase involved in cell wall biosynthesis
LQGRLNKLVKELNLENKVVGICVSRLVSLKRVDRCIDITNAIVNKYKVKNFVLLVAGDGVELQRLMDQVRELNIAENVIFLGAVENHDIYSYLSISQFFISMYAVSNVGNPMLEAIKSKKVIFTLNNGDTSRWICHKKNGYIYDENSDFIDKVACDIVELIAQPYRVKLIAQQIEITSNSLLYDWDTRLSMEFDDIVLLNDSNKGVI